MVYGAAHLVVDLACALLLIGSFFKNAEKSEIAFGFLIYNTIAFPTQMVFGWIFDRITEGITGCAGNRGRTGASADIGASGRTGMSERIGASGRTGMSERIGAAECFGTSGSTPAPSYARFPALAGCALIGAALLLHRQIWTALIVCALGNALFHVGGGIDSLRFSGGRFVRPGIFVAFGALGVSLGTWLGRREVSVYPVLFLVVVAFFWLLVFGREDEERNGGGVPENTAARAEEAAGHQASDAYQKEPAILQGIGAVIALCLVSVVIRSYAGFLVPMAWSGGFWFFWPSICSFLGKAAGGLFADRFGARLTGTLSLAASGLLLCLFYANPVLCGLGLLLFNMTMSVTVGTIYEKLPAHPGFAFGMTTFGLWLGYLPAKIFPGLLPGGAAMCGASIAVSAVCLFLAVSGRRKKFASVRTETADFDSRY